MGKLIRRSGLLALALCLNVSLVRGQTSPAPALSDSPAKKTVVFLGDSLTAGRGVGQAAAYPSVIAEKIRAAGLPFEVVNAGVSGDTSADGLRRLDWLMQRPVDVLVLALGGNDGLRGLPIATLQNNLQAIIDKAKARNPGVKIVIAGMRMPPNFGSDYAAQFQNVFRGIAQTNNLPLVPFLLEGVGGHRDLNQPDQIHPTAAGHKIIADDIWTVLEPILRQPNE